MNAGVICAPEVPGITDAARDLEALVRATVEAGGKYIYANPLFLKPCSAAVFLPFLEKEFPHLVDSYQQRYKDRAFLPKAYGQDSRSLWHDCGRNMVSAKITAATLGQTRSHLPERN